MFGWEQKSAYRRILQLAVFGKFYQNAINLERYVLWSKLNRYFKPLARLEVALHSPTHLVFKTR